jgi:glycerate 2-kinase
MRIVVAPDKFKGSLSAPDVAHAVAAGLLAGRPDLEVVELPVADGGDGTVAAAIQAGYDRVDVQAAGPTGEPVLAAFAIRDGTAVVELADVVGLQRLSGGRAAPLEASTYGLGQVLGGALDRGVRKIVIGLGGSASTDGGAGMLQALGLRLTDGQARPAGRGGAALLDLARVDTASLDPRLGMVEVLVAADVDNPLLGPRGAAAVFGPQKGASAGQVAVLERALAHWAELTRSATGRDVARVPGAGAAGGTGFGALAYLGASVQPGIELILDIFGFDAALAGADLVITGEGGLDAQTLGGKAPLGVARSAARRGIPVVAVAGQVTLSAGQLAAAGISAVYALTSIEADRAAAMAGASALLQQIGRQIAEQIGRQIAGGALRE